MRPMVVLFVLAHCAVVCAQQVSSTVILSELKSPDLRQRMDAYEKIKANKEALKRPDVRAALVDLLDGENQMMRKARVDRGEGYAEYVGALSDTVAEIADWHDQRQLCILAESPYDPGSRFAADLAVKGGAAVVPCLLKMAQNNKNENDRYDSIPVLVQLSTVTDDNLLPAIRQQIRRMAIAGLRDSSLGVRLVTVRAVGEFGTPDMIPILRDLARSDPQSRPLNNGRRRFDVREAAAKAIQSIKERPKSR